MLLALDTTSKSIEALTSGSSGDVTFVVTYADSAATSFVEGSNEGALGTTDTTVAAAPAASTRRVVKDINFFNTTAASRTVTLKYNNNGTRRTLVVISLDGEASWSMAGGSGGGGISSLQVGTTPVTGTNGRILYVNNAILGELATTGSGSVVLATSPTLVTPLVTTSLDATASTFNLLNSVPTIINFGAAATSFTIGGATSAVLNLAPGSGSVINLGGGANATELRFLEPSGSGTNYTALKAQAQAANITYTLPAADGSNGQVLATNGSGVLSWAAGGTGGGNSGGMAFKNVLHNGEFRVAKRGTGPFTSATTFTSNDGTYQLDRWYTLTEDASGVVAVSQTTDVPTGRLNSIGLQIKTANRKFGIAQIIEQSYGIHLTGMATSLSFKMRVTNATKLNNVKAAVFAWTGTTDTVTRDLVSSWNAGGTTPTWIANLTVENTISTFTPTTSWATYKSENFTIDTSGMKNIVVFIWSDVKDTTVDDWLYITDVQLEMGAAATDFESVPQDLELHRCDRYLPVLGWKTTSVTLDGPRIFGGFANADSTSEGGHTTYSVYCYIDFFVPTRIPPTALTVLNSLTNWTVFENASQQSWTITSIIIVRVGTTSGALLIQAYRKPATTYLQPTTLGGFCTLAPANSGDRLVFTGAEL